MKKCDRDRRRLVASTGMILLAFLFAIIAANPVQAQERPNIVVMVMDNLGWGEIGGVRRRDPARSRDTPP